MNRNTALIATGATALLCGCPGLGVCFWGVIFGIGGAMGSGTFTVDGTTEAMDPMVGLGIGLGAVCGGLLLLLIPVAVGFFTLRNAKA